MVRQNFSKPAIFFIALWMLISCTGIKNTGIQIGTKRGGRQTTWPTSTPERQGMDSSKLVDLLNYIAQQDHGIDSLLIIRNGVMILETYYYPYTRDQKHALNSCTKSFVSALVGIAIDKGYIPSINSKVLDYFPEYRSLDRDPRRQAITIGHLLTMTSGIDWPQYSPDNISTKMTQSNGDWVKFILERPMAAEPGSQANYSNGDAHLLSAIIQKATGETAFDFGWVSLLQPLGISDVRWDYDPMGISIGSAALYLTPRDMAKLGYLYLNDGVWEGKRIISADWVQESVRSHTKISITAGSVDYGYYWWIYPKLGMYEAWGGAGQRIAVFPELNIVTVITSDNPDDAPVTSFSTEIYRSIIGAAKSQAALPENPEASAELERLIMRAAQNRKFLDLKVIGLIGTACVVEIAGVLLWRRKRHRNTN
jgi:CubicO group peptidase (beta-lactamase class C family)